ncbi:phosphoenolpyruvate synthase [Phosphitispora fastidiosa]|uniref:phosphoenolpyruvate synthase n=1 Tax=Phosphitispora fastidiosa TaxID=2837202 RepID=UPI001E63C9D6|nr:phosphoenolpyruvate synthase [Phosphitispora fastidiosa]MBU7006577.1 pyruvate [Phosphitispora fastidiosa]
MSSYVLGFNEIDKTKLSIVGGKGTNLGELSKIEGIGVPEGFCVSTEAYKRIIEGNQELNRLLDQLSLLQQGELEKIRQISAKIRAVIEETAIAKEIEEQINQYITLLGEKNAYAVRSSATAEDLPTASFAGQQDTYLNIIGKDTILKHISKCWASLFSDRAVTYRMQNGFDHSKVYLSVVVQRMVFPQAAGIMFTADPVTYNRKVLSIDAGFGLGEALVSGLVNADIYKLREGRIIDKKISTKKLVIYALENGGTQKREIEPQQQNEQTLTDEQIIQLEGLGRKIEAYFGSPQDIEWCLDEHTFYIVQSRPITTLYPVPDVNDGKNRVYISFGHQQMMTEPIKPLGMSMYQIFLKDHTLRQAGGRLFYDFTHDLASRAGRRFALKMFGGFDLLIKNAMLNLFKRKQFIKTLPRGKRVLRLGGQEGLTWRLPIEAIKVYLKNDPSLIKNIMSRNEESIRDLQQRIANVSGDELFDFILQDYKQLMKIMVDPKSMAAWLVGMLAANWTKKKMEKWLGEKGAVTVLSQSVDNNVTSEMGLELLDVADAVRKYPAVIEYLHHASDETFFEDLARLEGGETVSKSIQPYLEKYGMRCSGEIDITRPRWSEQPTALIPMILSNIRNFEPNSHSIKVEQGLKEAKHKEQELLSRLEQLPGGRRKSKKTKKMVRILRNLIGYREYPKYTIMQRNYIYKQALLRDAGKLAQNGVIRKKEDIYYLTFEELREAVKTNRLDYGIITKRKAEYEFYEKLTPPRLMTSEGEVISGEYNTENIPQGALAGIPVSTGIIEGRARVVLKLEDAIIEEDDILVTKFTDPGWTPLFVSVKGLVTEVGGMMTHGAVIAREYGLPAVVGVNDATKLIQDGQRIRVNGTEGYVEPCRNM